MVIVMMKKKPMMKIEKSMDKSSSNNRVATAVLENGIREGIFRGCCHPRYKCFIVKETTKTKYTIKREARTRGLFCQ